MTKISQLSDVGSALTAQDALIVQTPADVVTPNKKVTMSGLSSYLSVVAAPFYNDITVDTTPFIWNQSNDRYYEYRNTSIINTNFGPSTAGAGYVTQPDLRVHSHMRRVGLHPSGFVRYYLDGENSNFFAGAWLKIYEGEAKAGNGSLNNYVRKGVSAWASGTTYVFGDRVIYASGVWECIASAASGTLPASGSVSSTSVINNAASGNVMVEVPEFFVRVDWNDGLAWKNIDGANVTNDYSLLSPSGASALDPLRVYYVLRKQEYDTLGPAEKVKWVRHPAFWASGDTTNDCTIFINGISGVTFEPSPYVTQRDASGVTRVWNGNAFGYYTSSGVATTSGAFNPATATRYRYIAAYQCTTDGTRLQSVVGSGVYTAHTRASGLTRARAIASGWTNGDYALWNACQLLTAMEYRNFSMQDATVGIGRGRDSYYALTGYRDYPLGILNTTGNRTSSNTTDGRNSTAGADERAAMQWRGIENYYAATSRWCNGINVLVFDYWVSLNPDRFVDNTSTNYSFVARSLGLVDVYQGGFNDQGGVFFVPQEGGTTTTYVTDLANSNGTNSPVNVGGSSGGFGSAPFAAGPWYFHASTTNGGARDECGSLLSR